jgi:hypothetical protein
MPRDDNPKPKKPEDLGIPFSPEAQRELIREQVNELIDKAAKEAVDKVFKERFPDNPYEQPAIDPDAPRAYTSEEVVDQFMESVAHRIRYWQTHPNCGTMEDRVSGVVHSLFAILDGRTLPFPAFDLVPAPCDGDKEYHLEKGENYYDPEAVISTNLTHLLFPKLHELYPDAKPESMEKQLTPEKMRETFVGQAIDIADIVSLTIPDKHEACQKVVRDMIRLIDGEYSPGIPPFMLFPAPSREFNRNMEEYRQPTWGNDIPLNRKAPTYGAEDSLVQTYDEIRDRQHRAARDMFK